MKIAVLMTCFNRAMTTIECLRHLFSSCQSLVVSRDEDIAVDIWLNEDGCTDGSDDKIMLEFKGWKLDRGMVALHIVHGSGNDYWCGGMRRAWNAAIESGVDYDGYLWLNDDTMLFENALWSLLVSKASIVVGATRSSRDGHLTYSGRDATGRVLSPNGHLQECEMMNGNAVFVPASVFNVLGNFPDYFVHSLGDYDYARRARECGINVLLASEYVGTCDDDVPRSIWTDPRKKMSERLALLYSPVKGNPPGIFFKYNLAHRGLLKAVHLLINQYVRVLFPRLWNLSSGGD